MRMYLLHVRWFCLARPFRTDSATVNHQINCRHDPRDARACTEHATIHVWRCGQTRAPSLDHRDELLFGQSFRRTFFFLDAFVDFPFPALRQPRFFRPRHFDAHQKHIALFLEFIFPFFLLDHLCPAFITPDQRVRPPTDAASTPIRIIACDLRVLLPPGATKRPARDPITSLRCENRCASPFHGLGSTSKESMCENGRLQRPRDVR